MPQDANGQPSPPIDMADNIKRQLKSLGVSALCPFLSFRFLVPVAGPGGIFQPDKPPMAMPHVVPCLGAWCGAAIKDSEGNFCGCGAAPGQDIANVGRTLDIGFTELGASQGSVQPPNEDFKAIAQALKKQGESLQRLVGAFIELASKRQGKPGGRKGAESTDKN